MIKSGESYRFTVDGLSLEWPLKSLAGKHVKVLVHAGDGVQLILDREDTADQVIGDDDLVHLDAAGVERLKTRPAPHKVHVLYNNTQTFELERRGYKTEELLAVFSVPAGYKLDLVRPDGEFIELKPGETTPIREGLEFVSHPPDGKSS